MKLEIQKVSLKEKIASILMQRIIDGEISVGDKLKETHLAKEFGVSQAPVWEAIVSLTAKGILEHTPNVGTHVKAYSKEETIEIYQAREALELYVCSFVGEKTQSNLMQIEYDKILTSAKNKDIEQLVKHDQFFHELLLEACDNSVIMNIWREQYTKSAVSDVIKELDLPLEQIALMHKPILEAMQEQSIEKCTEAIKNHYQVIIKKIKDKT